MSSGKLKITMLGILVALTIVVGGGLTAIRADVTKAGQTAQAIRHTVVSYQGINGESALVVLEQEHHIQTKTFSGIGKEVTSIDGVAASSKQYWAFYVDGKMAQVGADAYTTKPGDTITWKLESL